MFTSEAVLRLSAFSARFQESTMNPMFTAEAVLRHSDVDDTILNDHNP